MGVILLKFAPGIVFKERKTMFEESLENSNFYKNGRYPKFALFVTFGPNLTPFFSLKIAEIEKN